MATQKQSYSMDGPATYQITLPGHLNTTWVERYCGDAIVTYETDGPQPMSTLQFNVSDQANLIGIVNMLYNRGLVMVSLQRMELVE